MQLQQLHSRLRILPQMAMYQQQVQRHACSMLPW
jgi:hypothetical protein